MRDTEPPPSEFEGVEFRTGASSKPKVKETEDEAHDMARKDLVSVWKDAVAADDRYGETVFFDPSGLIDSSHRINSDGVDDGLSPYFSAELDWVTEREGLLKELNLLQERNGDLEISVQIDKNLTSISYSVKKK